MFIFYYAVLSEVTPPTALAAVAAAAITGGKVMPTMWQTWKYTLPAFLVPIAFVLTDNGSALLLRQPVARRHLGDRGVRAGRRRARGRHRRLAARPGPVAGAVLCACGAALLLLYLATDHDRPSASRCFAAAVVLHLRRAPQATSPRRPSAQRTKERSTSR